MPGEENLGELEGMLDTSSQESGDQLTNGFQDDKGQGENLLKTSQGTQSAPQSQQEKLLAGKYKTVQDLEKGYLSQNKGYQQQSQRAKQLESMLQNPKFADWAAKDPEMREALSKLGYELQEEDSRQDERQSGGAWNGDQNDPRFVAEVVRQESRMQWDQFRFEKKLGRDLSDQEIRNVKQQIVMAPRLTWEQAWKLTPHFEKEMAAKHEKELTAARGRSPVGNRPRPVVPGGIAGPKTAQGRNALSLKDGDKAEFLNNLIQDAERSGQ